MEVVGRGIVSTDRNEAFPAEDPVTGLRSPSTRRPRTSVSQDGEVMVLAITDHPDGYGGDDLWVSDLEGGAWSIPRKLGPEVDSSDYEYGPTLSCDERSLYFTSHCAGSADIYRMPLSAVLRGPG